MAPRELPRALRRPLLKPKQAEAMRQAVREIDLALIILAAMPDLFETVAFPQRVREQTVAAMWGAPPTKRPVRVREDDAQTRRHTVRHRETDRTRQAPPQRQPKAAQREPHRPPVVPPPAAAVHHRLREVLPVPTLRRVTLVAALSQWRLVVAQRSRHIRMLARALGACRARMFRAWRRVTASLRSARRAAGEAAAAASAGARERLVRRGTWPRLVGEAQHARRSTPELQRWRNLEARAVLYGWSVLARRGRVLRQRPWVLKHSLVLRRCLRAWRQLLRQGALAGRDSLPGGVDEGLVAVASAAPFVQRMVFVRRTTAK